MKRIERANAAAEKKWLEQQGLEAEKKKGPLTDERLDAKIRTMVKEILPENDNGAACRCKYVSDK